MSICAIILHGTYHVVLIVIIIQSAVNTIILITIIIIIIIIIIIMLFKCLIYFIAVASQPRAVVHCKLFMV